MARVIWDQPRNPPKYVSDQLGISRVRACSSERRFMKLSTRAIFVLRTALSNMMMVWSRMSMAMSSATSMTNSESTIRAFATLRFAGDALDPDEISDVVKERPTKAHRKGEIYRPTPRSPEVTGNTGIWYFV